MEAFVKTRKLSLNKTQILLNEREITSCEYRLQRLTIYIQSNRRR